MTSCSQLEYFIKHSKEIEQNISGNLYDWHNSSQVLLVTKAHRTESISVPIALGKNSTDTMKVMPGG